MVSRVHSTFGLVSRSWVSADSNAPLRIPKPKLILMALGCSQETGKLRHREASKETTRCPSDTSTCYRLHDLLVQGSGLSPALRFQSSSSCSRHMRLLSLSCP